LEILLFNWRDWTHPAAGGAEKATYEICKRLVRYGSRVHMVVGSYPNCEPEIEIDGMTISRVGGKYGVYPRSAMKYYFDLRGRYDAIVDEINTIPFFTPLYAKEPVVAFIHQLAADVLYEQLPWPQATLWACLEPKVIRLYERSLIVTSRSTKQDLVKLGIPEARVRTIDYGVDRRTYRPGKKADFPSILYVGRIKRFKGIHFLLDAMEGVLRYTPEARLTIIGTGDEDYVRELKRQARSISESKIIFFEYGFDEYLEHKVRALQEAWVLAFPSIREGFGLSVAEANACGTPAVVFDSPGLRETVIHGKTGLIVPQRDVEALSTAIIEIIRNPALRSKLSEEALNWSRNFDWDVSAKTMYDVLNEAREEWLSRG